MSTKGGHVDRLRDFTTDAPVPTHGPLAWQELALSLAVGLAAVSPRDA